MTRVADDDLLLLNALVDQELDAGACLALEKRLANEPDLAVAHARIVATKEAVGRLEKPEVSDDFYARMAALASPTVVPMARRSRAPRQWLGGDWRAIAASIVLTAFLASGGTYMLTTPSSDAGIEAAVIGGHQRSLLASNPVDVVSSDRHTVRPWLDAKLGISPPTPDLAAKGFPLVGGRVDVVEGRTVPTLVYSHNKHLISVIAIPTASGETKDSAPVSVNVDGYNVAKWSRDGFRYWAVSDLDPAGLAALADDLSAK